MNVAQQPSTQRKYLWWAAAAVLVGAIFHPTFGAVVAAVIAVTVRPLSIRARVIFGVVAVALIGVSLTFTSGHL